MNVDELLDTVDAIGSRGHVLPTERAVVLHNSLLLLQNENHFRDVFYWGRVFGTDTDYHVAYGYVRDALRAQVYYYSTDCVDWGLLPPATDRARATAPHCTTRFQGDPALVIDVLCDDVVRKLKEEDRLAATVARIDDEARVVPRGALFKRPDGVVVRNVAFEGLSEPEARDLLSYLHFRKPRSGWNTNLLTRKDYNYALDFLDAVDVDVPEGSWLVQTYAGAIVTLSSLYWPGMTFYHRLRTPRYGCVYAGFGKKNLDLPFMLPPDLAE